MCCDQCGVAVEARFPDDRLSRLPIEHQRFIEMFVLSGGNLKDIATQAGVSYPTVRSRLDKIIETLRAEIAREVTPSGSILDVLAQPENSGPRGRRTVHRVDVHAAGELIKSI
ncbi:MAG: DUF2089 family protein [Planctomycetaceae bacterium]|nr:DUF2089 family protein [Planctomycetaceae bacterium]MCA9029844.1 DUF2089 family protein [Planctomycetaceae bacterium]MCA9045309.1 DUF2089 family protein [Planctomycetaceae bacterium]